MDVGQPAATHPAIMWVVRLTWAQEWKADQPSGVVFSRRQPTKSARLRAQHNRITATLGLRIGLETCPNSTFMCWGGNRIIDPSMSASAALGGGLLWRCGNHLASHVDLLHVKLQTLAAGRLTVGMFCTCCTRDCWQRATASTSWLLSIAASRLQKAAMLHAGIKHLSIPVVGGSKRITHHLSANFPRRKPLFEMAAFS